MQEGTRPLLDAAEQVTQTVLDVLSLQPVDQAATQPYPITSKDLGLVAYQLVLRNTADDASLA